MFTDDLTKALELERSVLLQLREQGVSCFQPADFVKGTHPPDIILVHQGKLVGLEIKEDLRAIQTGNVCFELRALTEALQYGSTFLIMFVMDSVLVFHIETLLQELESGSGTWARLLAHAGDSRASNPVYLVRLGTLEQHLTTVEFPFTLTS